jgi:murein DD-endopeptidase MepM/ murein hydrolase activator NlpD
MSDRLHIIISGDEAKTRRLLLSKRKVQIFLFATISLFIALNVISYNNFHIIPSNKALNNQITLLNNQLKESLLVKENLTLQVQDLQDLNTKQVNIFQQEKDVLLNSAVTELEERSNLIERIISNIGVDIKEIPKRSNNSGGPFIAPKDSISQELLFRSNYYMETINFLPLGHPTPGIVTSRFGNRIDPFNGKKAFHAGIDVGGPYGQKIVATADGIVTRSFFNGNYGQYIEICHGNRYSTRFAHLQKRLVKRGEKIKRGQTIGTLGNSGRSTGPHLHYEVRLNKKPINPGKFMQVDKLIRPPTIKLRAQKILKIKHRRVVAKKTS